MKIPAGLTSTGMTTSIAAAPTPEAENTEDRTRVEHTRETRERERNRSAPVTVMMRPIRSTAALGALIALGVVAGFVAVAAVILLASPTPPGLLGGFGPEATWAMPATAVASALGLTFLIVAVLADRRAEEAFRRTLGNHGFGAPREPERAQRTH
ncbi:hypothetical protein SUDANB121_03085 [Nocardiopsis dassonvillei]|uniref:hypothetical protein n=1 Tax=Nocardiopsis dassonvillei TaxID=2014 RepID=UPI003F54E08E